LDKCSGTKPTALCASRLIQMEGPYLALKISNVEVHRILSVWRRVAAAQTSVVFCVMSVLLLSLFLG